MSGGDFYSGTRREVTASGRWKSGKFLRVSGDLTHNRITLLVVNQLADSDDPFWTPRRTTAVTKLVWRIAF